VIGAMLPQRSKRPFFRADFSLNFTVEFQRKIVIPVADGHPN
jgi:hypothetical protein